MCRQKLSLLIAIALAVGLVADGYAAEAAQSQGRLAVTARVLVTSTVDATLSDATSGNAADQAQPSDQRGSTAVGKSDKTSAATPAKTAGRCATVAVRCSNRAPMRLSIDGRGFGANSAAECTTGGAERAVSLCADSDSDESLGVTVEY